MIGRWNGCLVCFAAIAGAVACTQRSNSVVVRVLTDGQNCIAYAQRMQCDAVGAYLRDNRRLPFSQPIAVLPDGDGSAADARGRKAMQNLAKVGYSRVMVVAFLTEPGTKPTSR